MLPGLAELLILLLIVAIFFGAGKLPQVMEAMGHGIKQFREASAEGELEARSAEDEADSSKR